MQTTERTTRLVQRIRVKRADGSTAVVEEWGDFLRVQFLEGSWSEWQRSGGRLRMGGQPVNETDDEGQYELVATGERLTLISPDR